MISDKVKNTIEHMKKEGRQTEVKIGWCADDILSLDNDLTPRQVEDVLSLIEFGHDTLYGVTWDTIENWINEVKEDNDNDS